MDEGEGHLDSASAAEAKGWRRCGIPYRAFAHRTGLAINDPKLPKQCKALSAPEKQELIQIGAAATASHKFGVRAFGPGPLAAVACFAQRVDGGWGDDVVMEM